MREPAVDDVGLQDPGFEAGQAGFDLGDHPAVDHALGDQVAATAGSQTPDQAGGFILVAAGCRRYRSRRRASRPECARATAAAAVSALTFKSRPSSCSSSASDGSTGTTPARQRFSIGGTSTVVTSPTRPRSIRPFRPVFQPQLPAVEALVGLVVQARGPAAELVDVPLDVGVDLLGQHPRDDRQRGLVGEPPALHEVRRQPGLLHRHGDRLASAVDDDRAHSHRLHEDHVDQQGAERLGIFHHRPAQLDDRELPVELPDEAHRLDQYVRLADGFLMHGVAPSHSLTGPYLASKLSIFLCERRVVKIALIAGGEPLPQGRARFECGDWRERHAGFRSDLPPREGGAVRSGNERVIK